MSRVCDLCAETSPDDAKFCLNCGQLFDGHNQATTPATSEATAPITSKGVDLKTITERLDRSLCGGTGQVGAPQIIGQCNADQREHSVVVIDVSGSMSGRFDGATDKREAAINAATNFIVQKARLDADDHVGIARFRERAEVVHPVVPLAAQRVELLKAVQDMDSGGGTDIRKGLAVARDMLDWTIKDIVRRILLLTDGRGGEPRPIAHELKEAGAVIDVIGVGPTSEDVDEALLREVASTIDGVNHYQFIHDRKTLVQHYTQLAGKTQTGT